MIAPLKQERLLMKKIVGGKSFVTVPQARLQCALNG